MFCSNSRFFDSPKAAAATAAVVKCRLSVSQARDETGVITMWVFHFTNHEKIVYHLVMTNIAMENHHVFKNGKPSISIRATSTHMAIFQHQRGMSPPRLGEFEQTRMVDDLLAIFRWFQEISIGCL